MKQHSSLIIPKGVIIPSTDDGAWETHTSFRWVYNRLDVALTQSITCAPLGIVPKKFPIFLKPITNLYGGGVGARKLSTMREYEQFKHLSGYFWMEFLTGDHLSHDVVMQNGKVVFSLTFRGHSMGKGMFDFWETIGSNKPLEYAKRWVTRHLRTYTGCVNLETLGGKIIECHLRPGDIDGFGNVKLMQSIVDVYAGKKWNFREKIPTFYEFALWGETNCAYAIDKRISKKAEKEFNLTFCQVDEPELYYQNPVGGVRVAIIGGYDKQACIKAREKLYENFSPRPRKPKKRY
jgi:hypothetical protein